jgi:Rhs element Vgr protein
MNPTYQLLSINVVKEVNRIPYARLVLIDGDAAEQKFEISNDAFFAPGKELEIKLGYEGDPQSEVTVFKGVVVGHGVEADAQGSWLTIEVKDQSVRLTLARRSAIYRDKTDDRVIGDIISNGGLAKGRTTATRPAHQELVQYYATDWDFMLLRADANGLLLVADDGTISLAEVSLGATPKRVFEYGMDEIYGFEIEAAGGEQFTTVDSIAWDAKKLQLSRAARGKEFNLAQGNLKGGDIASLMGSNPNVQNSMVPVSPEELQAWSDATVMRNRLALIRGRVQVEGIGDIKPLDIIEIAGIGDRFNGKALVTGVAHHVDGNGWSTEVQFGLAADGLAQRRDIADAPAAGLLPAVNGLQIGIVDSFEDDPDKELRVRVNLPAFDQQKIWARLASPDAGVGRGYFFRPEAGDEVVVGFFNDDPRQAVVIGALYSSRNGPPDAFRQLTRDNIDKGIVTRTGSTIRFVDNSRSAIVIETPRANKVTLDDDAATIEIADQHGNVVTMSRDGVEIKSVKDLKIDASGNVEIKGAKIDLK